MSLTIKSLARQAISPPRCFKHWERDLGFTNRAGIETYQNLQHFLRGINYLTHSKAIGRAEAALEKRIEVLATDPYQYSEAFNRQLRHNVRAITHRWLTISSLPGLMFLADHLIDKQPLNPSDPFLVAVPTAILMGIGHFVKLKKIVEMISTHQLEVSIRENEERFRQLSEATSEALLIMHDGIIVDVNNRACQLLGLTKEEMSGTHVSIFVDPESHKIVSEMIRTEGEEPYEAVFVGLNSQFFIGEVNPKMIDYKGKRLRIAAIRDITERKQSEKIDRFLHNLAVKLSAVTSLDEALAICTDQTIKMTGLDSGGFYLLNQHTGLLELKYTQNLGPVFIEAVRVATKDSQRYHLAMAGQPIFANLREDKLTDPDLISEGLTFLASIPVSQNGQIIGCLNLASHSLTEISDRAKYALEMTANQVGGAIARLQSQQLLFSMERAAAQGKMVGAISHALKNSVLEAAGTLENSKELTKRIAALFDILQAFTSLRIHCLSGTAKTAQKLINQVGEEENKFHRVLGNIDKMLRNMLSLSRVGTEERTILKVKTMLEETLHPFVGLAARYGVKLETDFTLLNETDGILISETTFQDMVRNLVTNSIEAFSEDYKPAEGKLVRVLAHPNDHGSVIIIIEDNGPGMPPDRLSSLFNGAVRSFKKNGTGLGLLAVRDAVTSAQGTVSATSKQMKGTTFTVALPRLRYEGGKTKLREAEFKPLIKKEEARQLNVYLVDDDLGPLDVIETRMKRLGFNITSFTNPETALAAYDNARTKPDIVLTDLGMPQMSGDQLLMMIDQIPAARKPRYIVYSGDPPPEEGNDPLIKTIRDLSISHIQKGASLSQFDHEVTRVARAIIDQIPAEEFKAKLRLTRGKEKVNNPYSVMVGRIAHDMNNILGALIGNAELLLLDMDTEYNLDDSQNNLVEACLRMIEEIKTLVQFTKAMEELETVSEPERFLVKSRLGNDQRLKEQVWRQLTPADRPKLAIITHLYLSPLVLNFKSELEHFIQTTESTGFHRMEIESLLTAAKNVIDLNSAVTFSSSNNSSVELEEKFQAYYQLLEQI